MKAEQCLIRSAPQVAYRKTHYEQSIRLVDLLHGALSKGRNLQVLSSVGKGSDQSSKGYLPRFWPRGARVGASGTYGLVDTFDTALVCLIYRREESEDSV